MEGYAGLLVFTSLTEVQLHIKTSAVPTTSIFFFNASCKFNNKKFLWISCRKERADNMTKHQTCDEEK